MFLSIFVRELKLPPEEIDGVPSYDSDDEMEPQEPKNLFIGPEPDPGPSFLGKVAGKVASLPGKVASIPSMTLNALVGTPAKNPPVAVAKVLGESPA